MGRLLWTSVLVASISGALPNALIGRNPTRAGSLSVVVTSDDRYGAPIPGVDVTLAASDARPNNELSPALVTADDGRCVFENVPTGYYIVRAEKSGYVTTSFGATVDDGDPTPIAIAGEPGETRINIRIAVGGAIAGVVRNSRGVPTSGVTVEAMVPVGGNGTLARLAGVASIGAVVRTETDSLGHYRLYGLPRGDYLVRATSVGQNAADAQPGMSRAYFPGAATVAGASMVTVEAAQEITSIDLQLQTITLVNVSGQISWPSGAVPDRLLLLMFPDGLFSTSLNAVDANAIVASPDGLFTNPVRVRRDGTFSIQGVPPGSYELWVRSAATDGDRPTVLWGTGRISVGTEDLSTVAVALQPATTITGRVDVDSVRARPGTVAPLGMSITLTPEGPASATSTALPISGSVDADGHFRIHGAIPGRYTLNVSSTDSSWTLASAATADRDLFDARVDIAAGERLADIALNVTTARQSLRGRLIDGSGRGVSGLRVVVFPEERSQWLDGSRRFRSTKTATDGTFTLTDLPAGRYHLGATTVMLSAPGRDHAVLDALVPVSVGFTLDRHEQKVIDVRIPR